MRTRGFCPAIVRGDFWTIFQLVPTGFCRWRTLPRVRPLQIRDFVCLEVGSYAGPNTLHQHPTEDIAEIVLEKFPDASLRMDLTPCFLACLPRFPFRIVSNRFQDRYGNGRNGPSRAARSVSQRLLRSDAWRIDSTVLDGVEFLAAENRADRPPPQLRLSQRHGSDSGIPAPGPQSAAVAS